MDFVAFAAEHGLLITHLISGRWVRCATIDKPGAKKNGSYIYTGDSGAIQNWAVHERPICWRDKHAVVDKDAMRRNIQKSQEDKKLRQEQAAKKAGWIMHHAVCDHHPYLSSKGLPHEKGWVWQGKLVVPMRIGGNLVGCQLIDAAGEKKFLYGQQTKGAIAQISSKGVNIYTEGYATALSVKAALKNAGLRYNIMICFSAANLCEIAAKTKIGLIVADNDKSRTGENSAIKSGLPYWISTIEGQDFNDFYNTVGAAEASRSLVEALVINKCL